MVKGGRMGRQGNQPGFGTGLFGGVIAGSGGGGGALFGSCKSDDTSFYCQLSRFTSIIMQLVQLVIIAIAVYFGIQYLRGKN
jgi:hypothetical protein